MCMFVCVCVCVGGRSRRCLGKLKEEEEEKGKQLTEGLTFQDHILT